MDHRRAEDGGCEVRARDAAKLLHDVCVQINHSVGGHVEFEEGHRLEEAIAALLDERARLLGERKAKRAAAPRGR